MAQDFPTSTPTNYSERLYNEDLAPVPSDKRTWKTYSIFAMWMSDVHSIGGYTFAAGLFFWDWRAGRSCLRWSSAFFSSILACASWGWRASKQAFLIQYWQG